MPNASVRRRERLNRWTWALVDSIAWVVAVVLAAWLRYDLHIHQVLFAPDRRLRRRWPSACQVVFGAFFGPYAVGHDRGSFEETYDVGRTVLLTTLVLLTAVFAIHFGPIPRSVPFTAPAFAILGMFSARFIIRSVRTAQAAHHGEDDRRVVIFGAGRRRPTADPQPHPRRRQRLPARSPCWTTTRRRRGCGSRGSGCAAPATPWPRSRRSTAPTP